VIARLWQQLVRSTKVRPVLCGLLVAILDSGKPDYSGNAASLQ
jgi:hypothetical protein